MGSELVVALKIVADFAGEKAAGGVWGMFVNWKRRRRLNELLADTGNDFDPALKPVTDGLLGAGDYEIHAFRVICNVACKTSDFVNGRDPVRMDGAMVTEAMDVGTPELERVLLLLQSRACLGVERAPVVDARTLNGLTVRVPRSAVEYVQKLSEEAKVIVR